MTAFVAVADAGGFALAGRRLGLSPSAVTRFVSRLETHVGARLLQRTTRSVSLTDAGTRYLERARRILAEVSEAESAAQSERVTPSGHFVIAAPTLFGRMHVAPVVSTFLNRFPTVTAELNLADRLINLIDDGVDLSVRIGALEDSTLIARTVGLTRRVVVASPKYLQKYPALRSLDQLEHHELAHFTGLSPTPEWRFIERGTPRRIQFMPRFSTNSLDALIAHVERGGGLANVLAYQVADAVKKGKLRIQLPGFEPPPLPIHLVYPTSRLLSAKVRAFIDLVVNDCDWRFTS